jgi:hypothetical protein
MPTVHRIGAHKIHIPTGDHDPPHFHVRGPGCCSYKIEIGSWFLLRGDTCKLHGQIIEWATANMDLLLQTWSQANECD